MSLRRRLLLVVVLAALALGTAALSISHALSSTDAARLRAVESSLVASTGALGDGLASANVASLASASPSLLEDRARAAVQPLPDSVAGFCANDGRIVAWSSSGKGPGPDRKPKPLPPDQRDALSGACQASALAPPNEAPRLVRLTHPHDQIVIAARRVTTDGSAWILTRVPTTSSEGQGRWKLDLGLLSTATLLLVAVTLSAVFALGGGVRELEGSLKALQTDLRAPLPRPRTGEFAQLTAGLRAMAESLAEAQERERTLTRDLAHRDRLSALGRVAAGVAHEIRNPLAGIKLKLDVLERSGDVAPAVRADVRSCLDEVGRLDRVVQSLLLVARKSKRQDTAVDLRALVKERAAMLESLAASRAVTLASEGHATVTGDRDGLSRAFDNLLRNAIEASPEGGQVRVALASEDGAAEARIIDHGPGIDEARAAELFEPFFTTKPDGTGLGLWLSRALVEAHGGALDHAREGDATVFRMRLPQRSDA